MPRKPLRARPLLLCLLAVMACTRDAPTTPLHGSHVHRAQGDLGIWTVNSSADPGDGVCDDTECTLREAVASLNSGQKVVIASTVVLSPIQLTSPIVVHDKSFSLDGSGSSINGQEATPLFVIGGDIPITVTLNALDLRDGSSAAEGGAIRIEQMNGPASVTISNSVIRDSHAAGVGGGAIWVGEGNTLTLVNSAVLDNQTSGLGGAIFNNGTLIARSTTFNNNAASTGGAIYNAASGSTTISLSTISGNTATSGAAEVLAGGIANEGSLSIASATFALNSHTTIAQYSAGAASTVRNTLLIGPCGFEAGSQSSLGHNMGTSPVSCGLTMPTDISLIGIDPFTQVLEPTLNSLDGIGFTHALIARGLAVDAGKCPGEIMDQRGFARPYDDPTVPNVADACDIGAWESHGGPRANLTISQTVDKINVKQGDQLTYTVRVRNLGPEMAPSVVVTNVLSSGVTFVEARTSRGGAVTGPPPGETGTITWNLRDMAVLANETSDIKVTVIVRGKTTITNTASVTGNVVDPNPADNTSSMTVSVASGSGGGGKGGGKK